MKTQISILGLAVTLVVAFVATDAAAITPRLGFSAGANFQSMNGVTASNLEETFDNRTGYNAGVFVDVGLGAWGIRPGVEYLNTGSLYQGASFIPSSDFSLSYVVVPVDVRMSLGTPGVAPYFFTGPEFRVLASSGDAPTDLENEFSQLNMNWSFGAGIQVGAPGMGVKLMPEVRYSRDISGLTSEQFTVGNTTITTDGGQKVHSWRAGLKLMF